MRRGAETTSTPRAAGHPTVAARARLAIIRAEYNSEITSNLERKCLEALERGGVPRKNIERFSVPGCLEIPLLAQRLAALKRFHAMIALGAVIRGETHHFKLVAEECARGVMEVMLVYDVPIIFQVLATYRRRDALRRAGNNRFNKGLEAAQAALAMLATLSKVKK